MRRQYLTSAEFFAADQRGHLDGGEPADIRGLGEQRSGGGCDAHDFACIAARDFRHAGFYPAVGSVRKRWREPPGSRSTGPAQAWRLTPLRIPSIAKKK